MGQLLVVNFGEIKNWTKIYVIQGCLFLKTLPLAVYLHIGMVLKTLPLAVSCQYSLIRSDNSLSDTDKIWWIEFNIQAEI